MTANRLLALTCALGLAAAAAADAQDSPAPSEVRLLVGDQFVLEPGFAVGDISVGNPKVADYQVRPGRRAILLLGKGSGRTKLILFDQTRNRNRTEFEIVVETLAQSQAEDKLKTLLRDFPSVRVERAGGDLVVQGSVSAQEDLAIIERMAKSTGATSYVRFVAPERTVAGFRGAAVPPPPVTPPPTGGTPTSGSPAATTDPIALDNEIEYDLQVMEASVTFGSASYETGIEPSGRVLHTAKVRVALGADGQTFIPGKALESKDIKIPSKEMATTGIRLTLTPTDLKKNGDLSTRILIETNMPVKSSAYVPGGWRRARWESDAPLSIPFTIAGADLLVVPELSRGGGTLAKVNRANSTAGAIRGLPGVSSLPGTDYAGSVHLPYYSKDRKTHLLVLLHARPAPAK